MSAGIWVAMVELFFLFLKFFNVLVIESFKLEQSVWPREIFSQYLRLLFG